MHFLLAFLLALALQSWLGLPLPRGAWRTGLHVAGTLLANAGGLLALWCMAMFWRSRTTLLPGGAPRGLVVRGPYRWSRNPMYLSLVMSYVGLSLMLDVPWALAALPLPLWLLDQVMIPFEEGLMRARFGRAFDAYCERVRRWC